MTDHDAGDDTPRLTATEATALAVLDRRGRAAAAALTAALAPPAGTSDSATPSGLADDLPLTVDLRHGRRSRRRRHPGWLAAAAVVAVAGLVATISLRDDEGPGVTSGSEEEADPFGWPPVPLQEGQTEVAAGVHEGEPWQLRWTRRPDETAIELWWGDGSSGTAWTGGEGGGPQLPLEVSSSQSAAWPGTAVFGTATGGSTVSVDLVAATGTEPVETEMVELPDGPEGFVAFLPAGAEGDAVIVARDATGREVARDSVVVVPAQGGDVAETSG